MKQNAKKKRKQQNERVMCLIVLFFCRKGQFVRIKHTQRQHIRMHITVLFKYLGQKHTYTQNNNNNNTMSSFLS